MCVPDKSLSDVSLMEKAGEWDFVLALHVPVVHVFEPARLVLEVKWVR